MSIEPGAVERTERPVDDERPERAERPVSGMAGIDEVVGAVDDLDDRPVDEHVVVFEAAHGRLRQALDDPADD